LLQENRRVNSALKPLGLPELPDLRLTVGVGFVAACLPHLNLNSDYHTIRVRGVPIVS
jgi:hypothetical protein